MRLDDLYELLADDENGFSVQITETMDLMFQGPDELLALSEQIVEAVEKVVFMALELGMFLPEEVFSVAQKFIEKDGVPERGVDY